MYDLYMYILRRCFGLQDVDRTGSSKDGENAVGTVEAAGGRWEVDGHKRII